MSRWIEELERLLAELSSTVSGMDEAQFVNKPSPQKWSKLEILGHLCDSAANNHVRFTRILTTDEPITVEGYVQDEWVKRHGYQHHYSREELHLLWNQLNGMILNVLRSAVASDWAKRCFLSDGTSLTLDELLEDYVRHAEHHLGQIREIR
ncbi:DinB family protein [Paenibacillus sp. MBLB2552]|uniref:DinB family protein n=1 Tax=Paenibacillus mellifer TaxID=2937794 RepID=A0A9X1XYL1_9BACL|nr:DinB family protein [Paenibacillus mellifer]MCK8487692.1 DinB family protein [Paenibacillus mellifer]